MFENINLETELYKIRENKTNHELDATLEAFKNMFRAEWEAENRLTRTLDNGSKDFFITHSEDLPSDRIYSESDIKSLCTNYRLRFLPTKYFKSSFPPEAMRAIKETEKIADIEIKNFMIIAPSGLFKLEDANKDPLLFVPLSNNRYYLIHKWGNDMAWHRKLRAWPFKSLSRLVHHPCGFCPIYLIPGTNRNSISFHEFSECRTILFLFMGCIDSGSFNFFFMVHLKSTIQQSFMEFKNI